MIASDDGLTSHPQWPPSSSGACRGTLSRGAAEQVGAARGGAPVGRVPHRLLALCGGGGAPSMGLLRFEWARAQLPFPTKPPGTWIATDYASSGPEPNFPFRRNPPGTLIATDDIPLHASAHRGATIPRSAPSMRVLTKARGPRFPHRYRAPRNLSKALSTARASGSMRSSSDGPSTCHRCP